ncbi:MAG: ion channel [Pseudomonadota bacterium]|nr:ion channel [Pseudomonadota bacterium]
MTWTTLGYGDITPPVGIRLVAATEAVLGYVFFGLTVGLVSGMISPTADRPGRRR